MLYIYQHNESSDNKERKKLHTRQVNDIELDDLKCLHIYLSTASNE